MKFSSRLKPVLASSWLLALIPALLLSFIIPRPMLKYSFNINLVDNAKDNMIYDDLDGDNLSEKIFTGGMSLISFVGITNQKNYYIDQWNLNSHIHDNISSPFTGDYDSDNQKEIYIFSYSNDSLFLNTYEFFQPSGTKFLHRYITSIAFKEENLYSNVYPAGFYDRNNDGFKEVYFSITSGYVSSQPRKVYSYDIHNNEIIASGFVCVGFLTPELNDVDNDGKPEITGEITASGNYSMNAPFSDSSAWTIVYDENLSFEFPPVSFPGFGNSIYIRPFRDESNGYYAVNYQKGNYNPEVEESAIIIISNRGKEMRKRLISDFSESSKTVLFINPSKSGDKIVVVGNEITQLDNQLKVQKQVNFTFAALDRVYRVDIDNNGEFEFLAYSAIEQKLDIFNAELERICSVNADIPTIGHWKFSTVLTDNFPARLYVKSIGKGYMMSLIKNKYYFLSYLIYPGIFLSTFFFVLIIRKITERQIKQQEDLRRKLLALQLNSIKSQLDPHFTFNVLNSVASLVYMDDRKAAYDYLNKFTQMVRRLLSDADRIYRTLDEEVEFVRTYLELEKLRFGERLEYTIAVGEGITGYEPVPKLVIQTFAENAIKHGLMARDSGGMLKISIDRKHDRLLMIIEDNGIGRKNSAGKSKSTGKGLKLTSEFYEILKKITNEQIYYSISDLYGDENLPAGTRVEVSMPVKENDPGTDL